MIVKRPSLPVLRVMDWLVAIDIAVTLTFSSGRLSGPVTLPRMMSDSCARAVVAALTRRIPRSRENRRNDTEVLVSVKGRAEGFRTIYGRPPSGVEPRDQTSWQVSSAVRPASARA